MQYNGVWGTVCSNGFTSEAASVVCYSIGLLYVLIGTYVIEKAEQLIFVQKLLQAPSDMIRICAYMIVYSACHVKMMLSCVRNLTCILVILVVVMLKEKIANVVSNKFRVLCNVKQ